MLPIAVAVSVVIVGTVLSLMFSVPVAPLVRAVILLELIRLNTPLLVRVAVVIAPALLRLIVPALVIVVTAEVPLIYNTPVPPLVNPPVPASAVPTVNVPLLVKVMVVTVTLGIVNVPVSAWAFVLNVCIPFPAVKVPLLVIPPLNSTGEFAEVLVQLPPVLIVTKPVNNFAPVAEEIANVPLAPPPTVVVPLTVNANAPAVKVIPLSIVILLQVAVASTVQLAWISTLSVDAGAPLGFQLPGVLQFPA